MKSIVLLLITSFGVSTIGTLESTGKKVGLEIEQNIKEEAFLILQTKCNVCHQKKNKRNVFTLENMDGYENKIYKQVFNWKRMPKGNEIELTPDERHKLKSWIISLNQNNI